MDLEQRIDAIESAYEFMFAYAAQGRQSDQGGGAASDLRDYLRRMESALDGLGEVVTEATREALGETQTFQAPWHARLGQYVPPGYSVVGESHAEGDPGRLMATGDIAGWRDIGGGQYTRMTPERTVTETVAGTEPAAVEGLLRTDPGFREAVSHAFIPSAPTFQRNPLLEALMGQRFARMGQSLLGDLLQRRF